MKSILLLAITLLSVNLSFSQNVGIGTPVPETKLHVVDTFDVANGSDGAYINLQNATLSSPTGTLSGIRFRLDGVNSGVNSRFKGGLLFEKTAAWGVGSLHFATNAQANNSSITTADAKMTITSDGSTGIGTRTPETKLHVVDVHDVANGSDGAYINVQNATTTSPTGTLSGIRFKLDGVNSGVNSRYKGGILFEKTAAWGVGSLHFATNSLANNNSITNADARMTINSTGNVGIGNTNPLLSKLQIEGPLGSNLLHVSSSPTSPGLSMSVISTFPTFGFNQMYSSGYKYMGNGYAGMFQYSTSSGDLNYFSSTSSGTNGGSISFLPAFFTLDAAGRVGLSTSAPTAKLHVNGNMVIGSSSISPASGYSLSVDGKLICEEARVQISGSWPDYVFSDNYPLLPLAELEKSISINNHLPNMPAAAQVEKNGFDLGDMNKRLLEKVEELTLYIIGLSKENKALSERIGKLEQK